MFLSFVHHSRARAWNTPVALRVLSSSGHSLLMNVTSMLSNHSSMAVTPSLPVNGFGLHDEKCLKLNETGLRASTLESTEE
ncbi:hypothetical protein HanIR_Chr17g0875751 [Helianthus annuus]|nr:hypothetical protein HanIR_Chr17g0875751 [Helianthus annuus]